MKRDIENKFFREYQHDGAATLSLHMVLFEYCGVGGCVPARHDYPEGVLDEIKQRTEKADVWPWNGLENRNPLFDEISDNLNVCAPDYREVYIIEILKKLQDWTWLYSLRKDMLWAKISNECYQESIEYYFLRWRNAYLSFVNKFAVELAMRGINLLDVQNRCGIKIIEGLNIEDLWIDFGTREMAEYYLLKLNPLCAKKGSLRKAGRPKGDSIPFIKIIIGDESEKNETLNKLHEVIDGKKGKYAKMAMLACVDAGKLMELPKYLQVISEFPEIGSKQGYNNYDRHSFDKVEYQNLVNWFKC